MSDQQKSSSALHRLFSVKQAKVKAKKPVGKLLCTLAEDDHKRIARLLQAWLEKEEQAKPQKKPRRTP